MSDDISDTSNDGGLRDRFMSEIQTLSAHAQELLNATSTVSGDTISAARDKLQASLQSVGEQVEGLKNDVMERGRRAAEQADGYVRENPWQAIALGVVAGLTIGMASASLMKSSR